jgi:membrane associated rhomboid family serine protease
VFVLNNALLHGAPWPIQQERFIDPRTPPEAVQFGQVDRARGRPQPDGTFVYPIVVAEKTPRGQVIPRDIGYERVRYMPVLAAFGHFSTGKFWSDGQVWRLITFQFLHLNLSHLLLNMMGLWFVGGLVEQYLGRRRYAVFYLTSGVFGALAYLFLNLIGYLAIQLGAGRFPLLLVEDPYTPLIGASAGVFGVMMAAAYIAPTALVDVLFIITMRLRTAVYIFLAIAVFNLWRGGDNAGGDAAHVGGALAGAYLIRRPDLLRDILAGFGLNRARDRRATPEPRRTAVDSVLAKIRTHGTSSLTEAERAILHRASGR